MSRRDLQRDAAALGRLTLEDLKQAVKEEKRGERPSNLGVRSLKKHLKAVSSKVLGSDDARAANRSKIWSTTVMKSPPTLWITLNPADLHDPIAQVLAGEDIDMDDFIEAVGPDKDKRARNIARDPYVAAKVYDFVLKTLFKTLFKIDASGSSVKSEHGIFGTISAYFGVMEAQGRGTLHLHLVVWLEGAPTTEEMKTLLQEAEFREKFVKYIQANIRSHLDGFSKDGLKTIPKDREVPYSRPPRPGPSFKAAQKAFEQHVVRASQVHTCRWTVDQGRARGEGRLETNNHDGIPAVRKS